MLGTKYNGSDYSIGALTLQERPEFAVLIGKCIAMWSWVDSEMGNLFSLLLKTKSQATLEIFLQLRRASKQIEAILAAASYSVEDQELTTIRSMLQVYKVLEEDRNTLAHACFGILQSDANSIIWIKQDKWVHHHVSTLSGISGPILLDIMFVCTLQDLRDLFERMEQFWWAVFYLNGYLREPENSYRQAEFAKLDSFPNIKFPF